MKQTLEDRAKQKTALKEKLHLFNRLLKEAKVGIQKEREMGSALEPTLTRQLAKNQAAYAKVNKKEERAKRQSKKRKREIDEWKQWYNSLEQLDKTAEFSRLEQEIQWRAVEISAAEAEISNLSQKRLDIEGRMEQLKVQLTAVKEKTSSLPIEKDPRIKVLVEKRKEVNQALSTMTK